MTEQVTVQAKQNKAIEARKIFEENFGKLPRKEIINLFVTRAGLTEKGAATYYQNNKKAHVGTVKAEATVVVE